MHVCIYYDRIEMHRGKLTRIVTANWKEKRLDVYRRDEDGRERVRNLYCCMMGGYGVAFPGEEIHRNLPDIQKLDPWSEPSMNILSLASNRPSLEAQRLIEDRYPAFRYVMEKADLTCDEIIRILYDMEGTSRGGAAAVRRIQKDSVQQAVLHAIEGYEKECRELPPHEYR